MNSSNPAESKAVESDSQRFNILLIGGPGSGKTTLLTEYLKLSDKLPFDQNLGLEFANLPTQVVHEKEIKQRVYDIGNSSNFTPDLIKRCNASVIILVFDITDDNSRFILEKQLEQYPNIKELPVLLVGTKSMCPSRTKCDGEEFSKHFNIENYIPTDALQNHNLGLVFETAAKMCFQHDLQIGKDCYNAGIAALGANDLGDPRQHFSDVLNNDCIGIEWKLHSAIYLKKLSPQNDQEDKSSVSLDTKIHELITALHKQPQKSVTQLCVLSIAAAHMNQYDIAAESCKMLFHEFSPSDIPADTNNLRQEFCETLLDPKLWPAKAFEGTDIKDLGKAKESLLYYFILLLNDEKLTKRALWQALLPQTFLGAIFAIQRGWFPTSLKAGTFLQIATILGERLEKPNADSGLDPLIKSELEKMGKTWKKTFSMFSTLNNASLKLEPVNPVQDPELQHFRFQR